MERLILASASPQRTVLLERMGITFEVIPSNIDESLCVETDPIARAKMLASMKAEFVAQKHPSAWVIGCDTLVVSSENELLEKPRDEEDARAMLGKQSGTISHVHSALSLLRGEDDRYEGLSSSEVHFIELTQEDIDWWINTGLWQGCSGAFQIEGPGERLFKAVIGDWAGVVGLPVDLLRKLMAEANIV